MVPDNSNSISAKVWILNRRVQLFLVEPGLEKKFLGTKWSICKIWCMPFTKNSHWVEAENQTRVSGWVQPPQEPNVNFVMFNMQKACTSRAQFWGQMYYLQKVARGPGAHWICMCRASNCIELTQESFGGKNEHASQHCVADAPEDVTSLTLSIKMILMLSPGPQNDTYAGSWTLLTD